MFQKHTHTNKNNGPYWKYLSKRNYRQGESKNKSKIMSMQGQKYVSNYTVRKEI